MDLETFQKHELHLAWGDLHEAGFKVNGRSNSEILGSLDTEGDRQYHPCPESSRREERSFAGFKRSFVSAGHAPWPCAVLVAKVCKMKRRWLSEARPN